MCVSVCMCVFVYFVWCYNEERLAFTHNLNSKLNEFGMCDPIITSLL